MLFVHNFMSTQPISEISPVNNTISKTIEIDRTGPDMNPIAITKLGINDLNATIPRPLSHRYDVVSILSNWRLYKTWNIATEGGVTIDHSKIIWNGIAFTKLADYVRLVRADLEILMKVTSQAQQVGCIDARVIPHTTMTLSPIVGAVHSPFCISSVSFKLIPLGMNSDHQFTIPWNANVDYWNQADPNWSFRHGYLSLTTPVAHPIAEVPFTPYAQIFVRYVNVEFAGMSLHG